MRRVRCCYHVENEGITYDKEYEVIRTSKNNGDSTIYIINDSKKEMEYLLYTKGGSKVFDDITTEYRDEIIEDILK